MICIALAENDVSKCLDLLQQVDLAEIRLDLVNYSSEDIKRVFSSGKRLIATCRPKQYPDEKQMTSLKTAIEAGASYVDIEVEAPEEYRNELIKVARTNRCDVIISYHNFSSTPDIEVLHQMADEMYLMGADVAKVATMVEKIEDVAKILSLYSKGKRMVAVGMGERGRITRLIAPLLGAEFTFTTLESGKETAPGQVTREKLLEVMEIIKSFSGKI